MLEFGQNPTFTNEDEEDDNNDIWCGLDVPNGNVYFSLEVGEGKRRDYVILFWAGERGKMMSFGCRR